LTVHSAQLRFSTEGDGHVIDLTEGVQRAVGASGVEEGVACLFVPGSTAAVTAMEYEPGGVQDLREALERLVPAEGDYAHNRLNQDTNSHAHIKAAIMGPSESVPVRAGRLELGTWQQLVLVDFDDRPRQRTVAVQVLG
jgi:secondary thiamine-phosphate synthase enzyme